MKNAWSGAAAALVLAACFDIGVRPPPDAAPDGGPADASGGDAGGGVDGATPDASGAGEDAATCPPEPVTVTIAYMSFMPPAVTVRAGCPVVWINQDGTLVHTATSGVPGAPDGTFDSGFLSDGQSFTFTFDAPGVFVYFCLTHPETMRDATVTVQ